MNTLQEAIDYLKIHGTEIGKRAGEGNQICKNIVNLYYMVYKSQCNGSIGLLLGAIEEYQLYKGKK